MKEYLVKHAASSDWNTAETAAIDTPYLETPDDIQAFGQLRWDADALYVHLRAVEKEIRAVGKAPLDAPCEDSCLEFFFSPDADDARYINIEFNPNKCVYLGVGSSVNDLVRMIPEEGIESIFEPKVNFTEDGWEIFYRIPLRFIRQFFPAAKLEAGVCLRANFYKCADLTDPPHYLSWSPIVGEPFTFHKQHCFGTIRLR